MYWFATRSAVVSLPKWRALALLAHPSRNYNFFTPLPVVRSRQILQVHCFKDRKVYGKSTKASRKVKTSGSIIDDKDFSHLTWWKERLEMCKKPSTVQLVRRLVYTNLLGVDTNLKNGNLKEGSLNWEMLQFKSKFPHEILLCRVGDFYEAIGIDACFLVEYAGLNPFGGLRSDSIPRAGCPVVVLVHQAFASLLVPTI